MMIERRLTPHVGELCAWTFHRFAEQCAARAVRPLVIYRPAPLDIERVEAANRRELVGLARDAGLDVIDLTPAFDSVVDRAKLILAEWDHHTTALGHQLLSDTLYEELVPWLTGDSNRGDANDTLNH